VPRLLALLVRALAATWRVDRPPWPVDGACVAAFWHGEMLPMIALHRGMGMVGLASRSPDGALLAAVITALGFGVARGSSSRGGFGAARALLEALALGRRPALAVDGPRGPALVEQPGARDIAARAGVPLVFGEVTARPALRLPTWDAFLVPLPFARVEVTYRVTPPP
jgi:lysophospholipid acyltransferase (LPLAT)-like uncharacterized protein